MPIYCRTLIYKPFLKLVNDIHHQMQIPFVNENKRDLIPFILSSQESPISIILFLRHHMIDPDFFKRLHNEFVENVSVKFNSKILSLLPYQLTHLISTLKEISNENLTNLPPLKVSVKKDTKLPEWVLKSVSLTGIVTEFFDSIKL
jgi:hypothetical protein